ncbi:hypothetical protein ACFS07_33900 [Undibacterium arcticum]
MRYSACFTAHVTGNFVLIGAALADPSHVSILLKFLAFSRIHHWCRHGALADCSRRKTAKALP